MGNPGVDLVGLAVGISLAVGVGVELGDDGVSLAVEAL
jgi:hypothetical protein